ncbi:MAG: LLM class flavin-dependent oxidoreductase [Actinomycetota bacterium]
MNLGLVLPLYSGDPARVMAFAERATALGFDGLFAFDHFFPPGTSAERASLEAFTTLSAVTVACPNMTIGTFVARAGVRAPGMLAKMAGQIDDMSGGNFILGLGAGDEQSRAEAETFGFEHLETQTERYELLADTVRGVRALLDGRAWVGSDLVPAMEGPLAPAPRRSGGPPVWIGGKGDAALRLAADLADGWNGWGIDEETFAARAAELTALSGASGRTVEPNWGGIALVGEDAASVETLLVRRREVGLTESTVWSGTAAEFRMFLERLAAAGASWAIFVPAGPADRMDLIADALDRVRP